VFDEIRRKKTKLKKKTVLREGMGGGRGGERGKGLLFGSIGDRGGFGRFGRFSDFHFIFLITTAYLSIFIMEFLWGRRAFSGFFVSSGLSLTLFSCGDNFCFCLIFLLCRLSIFIS